MEKQVDIEYDGKPRSVIVRTVSYKKWKELQKLVLPRTVKENDFELSSDAAIQFNEQLVVASLAEPLDLDKLDKISFDKLAAAALEVNTVSPKMEKN